MAGTLETRAATGPAASRPWNHRYILGMRVDLVPPQAMVRAIVDQAAERRSGYCCVTNVHSCMVAYDDPGFQRIINESDIAVPDSTILRKAVALRHRTGTPPAEKGADLMIDLCREAARRGVPVALVGGRDEQVLAALQANLLARFPDLQIVMAYSPPFREATEAEAQGLATRLNASGAGLIFVGLGCPKQERWMARFKPLVSATMIGVGAAFDFVSGAVKPSPAWVHRAGVEWLWRLLSEPKRLGRRYLTTSPRFLVLLARDAFQRPRAAKRP